MPIAKTFPFWTWLAPILALILYAGASLANGPDALGSSWLGVALTVAFGPILIGAIFAAVHHAEIIADSTGEPYGTLVLTAAVTLIELALIVSIMLSGDGSPELARDTVYSVVMIVCNGLVGACLLAGGLRFREQSFDITSASIYLAVLIVLATLTLILPNYTRAVPGPVYSNSQLLFVSIAAIALYLVFLYTQTIRHTEYFAEAGDPAAADHPPAPLLSLFLSGILLILSITAVVLLAKKFASLVDRALIEAGAPPTVIGVLIALIILLPEGMAALRAARRDELQRSLNLALGSSLATIGLTIPAVAALNLILQQKLVLGLESKETVLLVMTFAASMLTFGTGKTNILFGFLHLVLFGTFMFLAFVP